MTGEMLCLPANRTLSACWIGPHKSTVIRPDPYRRMLACARQTNLKPSKATRRCLTDNRRLKILRWPPGLPNGAARVRVGGPERLPGEESASVLKQSIPKHSDAATSTHRWTCLWLYGSRWFAYSNRSFVRFQQANTQRKNVLSLSLSLSNWKSKKNLNSVLFTPRCLPVGCSKWGGLLIDANEQQENTSF